jgi:hypothetical protein
MHFLGNPLAIVLAAVAAWLFGGLYYTALSRPWLAAMGKTMEQCQAEMASKSGLAKAIPFVLVFVAELVMAWVLYGIMVHIKTFSIRAGLITAAICWLGFVLTTIASNNAFAGRKPMLTVIDSIGWLGAMLLMGTVIGWMGM